jgi:hypothetical protein
MILHWGTRTHQSPPVKLGHLAALPLRLVVGCGFMAHGYAKLAKGPDHFISILAMLGVPAPQLMAWLTIGTELTVGSHCWWVPLSCSLAYRSQRSCSWRRSPSTFNTDSARSNFKP